MSTAIPDFITGAAALIAAMIDVLLFRPWRDRTARRSGMAYWLVVLAACAIVLSATQVGVPHATWQVIGTWIVAAAMTAVTLSMTIWAWRTR